MKNMREGFRWIATPVAVLLLFMSVTSSSAVAAMVTTQSALGSERVDRTRHQLIQALEREEIRNAIVLHGIDPIEARIRVAALTDAEVLRVAEQMDRLPAGGSFLGTVAFIALIVFVVLAITDYTGQTNVFPFIDAKK